LERIKSLATQVCYPKGVRSEGYPSSLDSGAKKALYDNLNHDENLVIRLDTIIRHTKESHWVGDRFKERKIKRALERELGESSDVNIESLMSLIKNQHDYL
jgi:type I restriction enzyme R subunit